MILRALPVLLAVTILTGCPKSDTKPNKGKAPTEQASTKDQNGDAEFQAFVSQLRKAVMKRDVPAISRMMAPNFGYKWEDTPDGETPFSYWDENNLWPELSSLVKEKWVPHNGFMVVPPQLAASDDYRGYRAGLTMIDGNWRFAYFVPAPPANQ